MNWFIPPPVLRWLPEVPADRGVALLLRHSVRPPLDLSASDHALPITVDGAALARELGAQLGPRLAALHTSPLVRCVQTAEQLLAGAGVACDITLDRLLGDPGVYVVDVRVAGEMWIERGHDAVMAYLAGGEGTPLPGLADPTEASRRLVGHMLAPGRGPGLHVFVTHDSLVTTTVARMLGRGLGKADWPLYLEGAFFWRDGRGIVVAYREYYEVCA